MANILVVDDEKAMLQLIKRILEKDAHTVTLQANAKAVLNLDFRRYDLILLDIMMPDVDGFELCSQIRSLVDCPIIFLTAKTQESDELLGFELGVDEYIAKPFSPKILVARVGAILRRTMAADDGEIQECNGIVLNHSAHVVTVDGTPVELSFKEFELLSYFMKNQGIALSREQILSQVWEYDYYGDARTIDTHVKKLRSKLGEKGNWIKTIWGLGYKMEVDES